MKQLRFFLLCVLIIALLVVVIVQAGGPNYATNAHPNPLYFDGYVQIQSSYNDSGYYAARGSFTYKNGLIGTQTYYTSWGTSMYDSTIRSKSARYWDSPDPNAPVVTFDSSFTKVSQAAAEQGVWPI